jgi:hypothetical protein
VVLLQARLAAVKRGLVAAIAFALPALAFAAGGYHGVDDATILGAGECEFESWVTYASRANRLVHAGGQCGIAGVEIGIAVEPATQDGARSDVFQAQVKWAGEIGKDMSVGLSVTPQWDTRLSPRFQGTTVTAMLTWVLNERWQLHANAGRDYVRGGNMARSGVEADWTTPDNRFMLTIERYIENGTHFARAGARWFVDENWTLDAGRAQRLRGPRPSTWTLGFIRAFSKN